MTNNVDYTESVRLKRLIIIDKLDKHLDTILSQITDRIGKIQKIEVRTPSRKTDIDTICYITLVDKKRHPTLIYLLNSLMFHGRTIIATPAAYTIRTLSSSHALDTIKCDECAKYKEWIERREIETMKQAIHDKIHQTYTQQLELAQMIYVDKQEDNHQSREFATNTNDNSVANLSIMKGSKHPLTTVAKRSLNKLVEDKKNDCSEIEN